MPAKGFTHESTYNESKEWYTPRPIFKALGLDFDLDPCSPGQDIVRWIPAQIHYTIREDGLTAKWFGNVFMNPPYGMDTPRWLHRLSKHGNGIALVFARPDTQWFHKYVPMADAICFIKKRIQFIPGSEKDNGATFAELYADGQFDPATYYWYGPDGKKRKFSPGAASMLLAFGEDNAEALFNSNLGLALPVSKLAEKFRDGVRFAGDKEVAQLSTASPYENPPCNAETEQGLFGD